MKNIIFLNELVYDPSLQMLVSSSQSGIQGFFVIKFWPLIGSFIANSLATTYNSIGVNDCAG